MTWDINAPQANEAAKIRWSLVPYMNGRVLDLGCGPFKALPHFIGVDNGKQWGPESSDEWIPDAKNLGVFASQSCHGVFSSHLLEHIPYEDVPGALKEWCRVIETGGHLMLYLPDEDEYPKVGERGANEDHKWNVNFDRVIECMEQVSRGWDLVEYEVRNKDNEYSLFFVFKLIQGREHKFSFRDPKPEKTVAIVRYGAQGDMVQTSSVLPWLKEQGYHVTLYCSDGAGYDVIKHDPHVDRFIVQGKDQVPQPFLTEFWNYTKPKYTKWINFCEAVEGTLLALPDRPAWEWPNTIRAKYMNRNYLEWMHELAGVPAPYQPKFYSTIDERAWARKTCQQRGKRNIVWSLSGSSGHKVWPWVDSIIARILLSYPDVHITLVGDLVSRILEQGWENEPRVHCQSGKWSIRESMAFAEAADLVIGTETGLLNAVGHMDVWKIINLSHSSVEMLTKHWKNTISLEQPDGVGCEKHQSANGGTCRQLHGANQTGQWVACPKAPDRATAMCQYHISPEMMWGAIQRVLGVGIEFERRAA